MPGRQPKGQARLDDVADRLHVCMVSMHTSPTDQPGSGDAGGLNVVVMAQAQALAKMGHRVDIVTRRSDRESPAIEQLLPGVRLRRLEVGPATNLPKSRVSDYIEPFSAQLAGLDVYDVYHSHHWMSGVAALPVAQSHFRPHIQSFHSLAAPPGSPLSAGEPAEAPERLDAESALARNSAVVAISRAEAATVIERCGADPASVTIISPGVDHQLFRPAVAEEFDWAARHGEFWPHGYLVFAARLQPLKAPDVVVRALAAMPEQNRPHLVLAGDGSADFAEYLRDLKDEVAARKLNGNVSFVGALARPDFAVLLRGARLVVVPSYSETFGLVALEAAASGTPVLASSAGGLVEAVVPGQNGWLLQSWDPAVWASALTSALSDPMALADLGQRARHFAQRFDWALAARQLSELYQRMQHPDV